jgi:hypothetical protein
MTTHTPPSRLALAAVCLVALACIALATGASIVAGQLREVNRDNIEVQRMSIEATKEANRVQDAADARREMKTAHSEGVNQGGALVLMGIAAGFGLTLAAVAFVAMQMSQRNTSTWG